MAQHKKDYKPEDILFPNQAIVTSELVGEMKTSYMEYAMSVIVGRALPEVRDGLKPEMCIRDRPRTYHFPGKWTPWPPPSTSLPKSRRFPGQWDGKNSFLIMCQ